MKMYTILSMCVVLLALGSNVDGLEVSSSITPSPSPSPSITSSSNYSIMSWNILACRWLDPSYYNTSYPNVPLDSLTSASRLPVIIRTINESNPDILFMQEVSDEPTLFLALKEMGYDVFFAPHLPQLWRDWDIPSQVCYSLVVGNIIAVRSTIFRFTYEHILLLSEDGDRAPLVHVMDKDGHNMTMVTVHLATDRIPSEQQIDYVLSLLPRDNVIIGGDFNGDLTARMSPLEHAVSHSPTHPYCDQSPFISLDHIYVGSNFHVSEGRVHASNSSLDCAGQVKQLMVEHGSDHYPVSAKLQWVDSTPHNDEIDDVDEEDAVSIFGRIIQHMLVPAASEEGQDEAAVIDA